MPNFCFYIEVVELKIQSRTINKKGGSAIPIAVVNECAHGLKTLHLS